MNVHYSTDKIFGPHGDLIRAKRDSLGDIVLYVDAIALDYDDTKQGIRAYLNCFKEWNEDDHPREPEGSSEGGQFSSGGGGGGGGGDGGSDTAPSETTAPGEYNKGEKAALGNYINDSTDLNKYMRSDGAKPNKEFDEKIAVIKSALSKNTFGADFKVWRGISECKTARDLRKNADKLVGQSVPMGGFQSTTSDEAIAQEFVSGYASRVILEITALKGTHVVDMSPLAQNFKKQKELLLGEGSLEITDVQRTGSGSAVLYVYGTYHEKTM